MSGSAQVLGIRKQSVRGDPQANADENWDDDLEVTLKKNLINMNGELVIMPVGVNQSSIQRNIQKKNFATHQFN